MRAVLFVLALAATPVHAGGPAFEAPDVSFTRVSGELRGLLGRFHAEPLELASGALEVPVPAAADLPNFAHSGGGYYRGGQPSHEGFRLLKRLGLSTVLDLRDDPRSFEKYFVESLGMRYLHIPLSAFQPPSDEEIDRFLEIIGDPATGPIFVHCQRGADRTGIMSAIRRMKNQGWEPKPAAREMVSFKALSPKLIKFVFIYYKRLNPGYEIPDLSEFIPPAR